MENKETIENNKLIAEFMGVEVNKGIYGIVGIKDNQLLGVIRYHDSWDWLMPVVEKIEGLEVVGDFRIEISQIRIIASNGINGFYGRIEYSNKGRFIDTNDNLITKIEAVYHACIEFIKWYNTQN